MEKQSFTNKIVGSLRQKKLLLFCLGYMLLPVSLLTPLANNIGLDDCIWSILFSTILLITLFVTMQFFALKTVKTCCAILLLFTLIPSAIFLAYLLFAQAFLLSDSITSIFETNPEESKEFIAYYMSPFITAGIFAYASIPMFLIFKIKGDAIFSISKNKLAFCICLAILVLFGAFRPAAKSIYFINFYETYIHYKKRHSEEQKEIAHRLQQPFMLKKLQTDTTGQTLVVVIGESLARHHMSLYGYGRKTNKLLSKSDSSLAVYDDVISPQVHTIPVIRTIMTFSERNHPDYFSKRPSLFELFNRAGYETYFISNQPYGGRYETSYDLLLTQAKHQYNPSLQKKPDEVVFPYLKKVLADKSKKNKLIVIHLMGNHMAYIFRYPEKFEVFNNDTDQFVTSTAKYMTPEAIKTVDRYDNSVRYNDYVISGIIGSVQHAGEPSAVVYFSDHGEEVYEMRDFAGHAYEKVSSYMCDIPFLVWRTPSFGKNRKDLIYDPKRPFSTADFLYSITDLAGFRYEKFDPTRSLFSVEFKPRERYVGEYTYQEVIEMTNDMK
jgi:heptose-I-phosphate ethanolaminephosphotransferase